MAKLLTASGQSQIFTHGGAAAWWAVAGKTCVAAYQPKNAASLAASYVNIANAGTYNAAPGVAPTWSAETGWQFDGATQWLSTGVIPSYGWSMIVRWSGTRNADTHPMIGIRNDGAKRFYINPTWSQVNVFWGYSSAQISVADSNASGIYAITQNGYYINGALSNTWTPAGFTGDVGIEIGQVPGINGTKYLGSIQAIAIYSDTLIAGQVATVSAAMAAL